MSTTSRTLLGIDGLGFVRRIYKANKATDERQKVEESMITVEQSFRRALREHNPTHCLFAFDAGGQTWRHTLFADYKANRTPMTPELQEAIVAFKARLASNGWAMAEHPGQEADDSLASLGCAAVVEQANVIVLSGDKDVASIGQYGVRVYDHFEHCWHDQAWSRKKFGVGLERIQDWLALVGDDVDGVPGVAKVGDKTATALLLEHGDLEGVLAAAANIKGKVGESLREQAGIARLSRRLTALRVDLFPNGLDWDSMRVPRRSRTVQ